MIMIIGLLSVTAIGGYGKYRRNALLNLAVDNFVAQVNELKEKTVNGTLSGNEEGIPKCYGLYFDGENVYQIAVDYQNKKKWNAEERVFENEGCADFEKSDAMRPFEFDDQIRVTGLRELKGTNYNLMRKLEDLVLIYAPPDGKLKGHENENALLKFEITYGNAENDEGRSVIIDLNSGKASSANFLDELQK